MTNFIILLTIIFSCQDVDKNMIPDDKPKLKSAVEIPVPNCSAMAFDLLIKQRVKAGDLKISNNNDYLVLEYFPVEELSFTEIKLWVGTNPKKVPSDKDKFPLSDKFKYKSTSAGELVFVIPLNEIYSRNPETDCESKKLYIFTHVIADITDTQEIEQITAWSEGTTVGNSQTVSYSTYTTCCKSTGGGGCFPHVAWGGNFDQSGSNYYYTGTGGIQNILADNGVVAGTIKWESGVFTFSFTSDWMFSDQNPQIPLLEIYGLYEPGGASTSLYKGSPSSYQGIYSVNISGYPYYQIVFNLQNCYLVNP